MKKIILALVLIGSMLLSASSLFASGHGAGDLDQIKQQLKDGSCQTALAGLMGSGDRDQTKLHLKDASCQTA